MSRNQFDFSFEPLRERVTWAVQTLIIINVMVFVGQLLIDIPAGNRIVAGLPHPPPGGSLLLTMLGFRIDGLMGLKIWQPFTYMFMHAGLLHLFMNMLWLYFFGPEVERLLGTRLFFRFYIACGALAILGNFVPFTAAVAFGQGGGVGTVVGASGATMGVLIAFAMINPDRQFFLFPIPVPINARAMVILVIVINVFQALDPADTTSVWTHFGGMAAGAIIMKFIPRFRGWQNDRRQRKSSANSGKPDDVGDAVDNIFRFDDRKRNR